MNVSRIIARFSLLTTIVVVVGAATVLFAKTSFAPLAPAEVNNGTLSGSVGGVSPNAQFIVTATGIYSDNVTQYTTSTVINSGGVYTFSNVPAGNNLGFGYGSSIVTYTVSAVPLAPCYSVTPLTQTVYMSDGAVISNVNFIASFVPFPVTITVQLTEAIFLPDAIPTNPVIAPPARSNGIGNFSTVTYRVQSSDGSYSSTQTQNVNFFSTTQMIFVPTVSVEPASGNCQRAFTVTVLSLLPPYQGVVNWRYVPANATQVVTLSPSSNVAHVPFLAWHYWVWTPILIRP
ncbi:MAG: hypothetical protein RMN25_08825 [Anaerolineae bacterium]|nr:hypothetical protein [Thermoflexales bacterium]MDW8407877.1 hypothetical protein [Anaerolineae bacterium]